MCLGRKSAPPPPPPPPTPRPPRLANTQTSPKPAEATSGTTNTATNVEQIRKGRKVLRIPLLSGAGTGVQIQN